MTKRERKGGERKGDTKEKGEEQSSQSKDDSQSRKRGKQYFILVFGRGRERERC